MIFPIGDAPNPSGFRAWGTWAIIAANVVVYVVVTLPLSSMAVDPRDPLLHEYLGVMRTYLPSGVPLRAVAQGLSQYDLLVFRFGYRPSDPSALTLFTSMFLHGGLLHLAGNMLFLWIFGDNVEFHLGRWKYLALYLVTGAVATLSFALLAGDSPRPLVGASGAISGLLGTYFLLFPRNSVRLFIAFFPFFFDTIHLPARWVLGFYVVIENLVPFLFAGDGPVAYGAHLGGFAAGAAIAYALERSGWGFKLKPSPGRGGIAAITDAVRLGDRGRALVLARDLPLREAAVAPPDVCVRLAQWLADAGDPGAGSALLRRCLAARSPAEAARVFLALAELRFAQGQRVLAFQHLRSVFDHSPDADTAQRARELMGPFAQRGRFGFRPAD